MTFMQLSSLPFISFSQQGWYGIRCENKRLMTLFLVLALLFVAAWATMFYSQVYRWTFLQVCSVHLKRNSASLISYPAVDILGVYEHGILYCHNCQYDTRNHIMAELRSRTRKLPCVFSVLRNATFLTFRDSAC
jgi:hypothetical protein